MHNSPKQLRDIFEKESIVVIPGAYDTLSSLLVQQLGFKSAYLGGFSISASKLGVPDWGLATMTEMLEAAKAATNALDIPLITDLDQGFGSLTNLVRAIRDYEAAGVAAVHFEDQSFPKKCSQQPSRDIIPMEKASAKIKAAVETRNNPDFMLLARTDSKAVEGINGVKRRIEAYLNSGADYAIFCEQTSEEELFEVAKEFPKRVIAFVEDNPVNPGTCLPISAYDEMGYKALVYCALGLRAAYSHVTHVFQTLLDHEQLTNDFVAAEIASLEQVNGTTQLDEWQRLRDNYAML